MLPGSIFQDIRLSHSLLILSLYLSNAAYSADWQYTIRPGDTIWALCADFTDYADCWRELSIYNNISEPQSLSVGERIKIPADWLRQAPVAAQVVYVKGDVFIGGNGQQQFLKNGQSLPIGERIVTAAGSVTLKFSDGSLLSMSEQSEITIDAVSAFKQSRAMSIQVSLPRGEAGIKVPPRQPRTSFKVNTPSAVAAVRGTRFRVGTKVEDAATRSEVLEGMVELSAAGGAVNIEAGYGSLVNEGTPIAPVILLDAPQWDLSCEVPGYAGWQSSPDATAYKLVLLENDTEADKIVTSKVLKQSEYTFEEIENKCYQLRVNAIDKQGLNGLEAQRLFCHDLNLKPPVLTSLRWQNSSVILDWQDIAYAEQYYIEISYSEDFSETVFEGRASASELKTHLAAASEPVYIRARSEAKSGAISSEFSQPVVVEYSPQRGWLLGLGAVLLAFIAL